MLQRDLREDLDEVEGPVLPRILFSVGQAVEPGLKLVQQQSSRLLMQELEDKGARRDVRLLRTQTSPLAADELAMGVMLEEQVPEELVLLPVQALADDVHTLTQRQAGDLRGL